MSDEDLTTIQLKKKTRERLKKEGDKGESYDDVINRILDEKEKRR
jgi:predicted CopG family antitoxin